MLEPAYMGHCLSCGAPCYAQSHCDKCAIGQDEEEEKNEDEEQRQKLIWAGVTRRGRSRIER